ncbi:MAG: hypothetical protein QOJ69_2365 [Actinomycetota bacterium]|nr:hypothetical protein [Actinomycetota bacterium]
MGKRVSRLLLAVVVTGSLLVFAPISANAQLSTQPFAAYGSGTAIAVNALTLGATTVADVHAAHSGGSVDSTGLTETLNDQFGQVVQPALPNKNAYGRGAGIEVGLLLPNPQPANLNQLILTQVAEQDAPPIVGTLVSHETPIDLAGILTVSLARGQAQATYDPEFCPIGRPLTYGSGYVENLSVLSGTVGTSQTGDSASESRTVTYFVPNGDGTWGVVSETRQIIAPISLAGTGITVDVLGPLTMKATATGKPGDPRNGISYPGTPTLRVSLNAIPLVDLSLQDLLGTNGLTVNLPGILLLTAGAPPTGLGGTGPPVVAGDGTVAAASVDAIRLQVLSLLGSPAIDLAVGHIEAAALAPAGGVTCRIPVKKIAVPDPVPVGTDATFVISIPSDAGLFNALFACDLVGIKAIDTVDVASGRVTFSIVSADHGGVVNTTNNTVTWENLGNYVLGQPPIELRIVVHVNSASGDAVLRDIVDVSATLGNCQGRAAGDDIVLGSGQITNAALTGRFVLLTPVAGGNLAATGGTALPLVVGGALALMALGLFRVRKLVTRRTD